MADPLTFDQLFSTTYELVQTARSRENLANELPEGYDNLKDLDQACLDLVNSGKLIIVDSPEIRQLMGDIKSQVLSQAEFQTMAMQLIDSLMSKASEILTTENSVGLAISVRGGMPFYASALQHFAGAKHGFSEQRRDEITLLPTSHGEKLINYSNMHTLAVDFMLATGGSLVDLLRLSKEHGASDITTVTAFSSPQGIIKASQFDGLKTLISLPLEAGLNYIDDEHHGFIVGGHTPNTMLGDFGDRFHGSTY